MSAPGSKQRIARAAIWVAATRVLINLTAFASTILLARLLAPSDFGIVAIATAITSVISALTELSLSQALVQHRDPQDHHFDSAFTLNLARAALLALGIAVAAVPVAAAYGDQRLVAVMLAIAVVTLGNGATNPKLIVFQRNLVFWQDFVLNVAQKVAGFVAAVAFAVIFRNYWALVAGLIATQLCALVTSYALLPFRPKLRVSGSRELLSFSIWLTLSRAANQLNWRSDPLAIGYFLGPVQLGFYTVGDNLASLPTREATAPIAQTLFPAFARIADDPNRLRAAYKRAHALLCAVAFPVGVGFALVAHALVLLLMGEKWLPAVPIIQILAATVAFQALSSALQPLAMATGDTKALFGRDLRSLAVRIPCMIGGLFVGQATGIGGVMGLIWGRAVSSTVQNFWNMQLVRNIIGLGIREQCLGALRPALATGAMALVAVAINDFFPDSHETLANLWQMSACILLAGATYVLVCGGLWLAAGRPEGAESEIAGFLDKKLLGRLIGRKSHA